MKKIESYIKNGKVIILEDGEKFDYIDPLYDKAFKTILKADKDHYIIRTLLKEILHFEPLEIVEKDSEFLVYGIDEKQERCDYLIRVDDTMIEIECNRIYSKKLKERNISHFRRLIREYDFPLIQINVDNYDVAGKGKFIYDYSLRSNEDCDFYDGIINLFHINLAYLDNLEYNEDELKTLERVCLLFKVRTREKMDALIRGDENLMEIKKIYEDIANDKEFVEEYTKEELERIALAEQRNIEIAKSMLSDGMDIEVVSKHTGLSISELENLSLD